MLTENRRWKDVSFWMLTIFSALLALGNWDPFSNDAYDDGTSGFTISQIFSILFEGYLIWKVIFIQGHVKYPNRKFILFFYILLGLSTLINSPLDSPPYIFFIKFFMCILLCYLIPKVYCEKTNYLSVALLAFAVMSAVIATLALTGVIPDALQNHNGRWFLLNDNPNSTAGRMALAALVIIYTVFSNPFKLNIYRFPLLLFIIPLVIIVVAGGSRGGLLLLVFALFLYFITLRGISVPIKIITLVLGSAAFGFILFRSMENRDYAMESRLMEMITKDDDAGRERINEQTLSIYLDNNALIGTGIIKYHEQMLRRFNEHRTCHNMYVYVLCVSGLAGFALFMLFLFGMAKRCWELRKKNPLAGIILIFMAALAYKTGGVLSYQLMWYMFAIIITITLQTSDTKPKLQD